MKRHFPGLHSEGSRGDEFLQGVFLVRVDRAYYRWHPQKPTNHEESLCWSHLYRSCRICALQRMGIHLEGRSRWRGDRRFW
jgi:hypothetical protein